MKYDFGTSFFFTLIAILYGMAFFKPSHKRTAPRSAGYSMVVQTGAFSPNTGR